MTVAKIMIFAGSCLLLIRGGAAACDRQDASLAGLYELQGVMETGSAIGLAADGRFQYMLTVGAFDEVAEGCWHRTGQNIVLVPTKIQANDGNPTFKRLTLALDRKGGLVRFHQGQRVGSYVRIRK